VEEVTVTGWAQDGGRRWRALRVRGSRTASAARRGGAGEQPAEAARRWEKQHSDTWARGGRCRSAGAREAAGGRDHARAAEAEELGEPRKKIRTGLQFHRNAGTLL
jgi:hypothetical protein